MTPKTKQDWQKQRSVGSILLFGAILFGLRYFPDFDPVLAVGFASVVTLVHFLILTWLIRQAEKGE